MGFFDCLTNGFLCKKKEDELKVDNLNLETQLNNTKANLKTTENGLNNVQRQLRLINKQYIELLNKSGIETELEKELNNKLPKIERYYVRQETDGAYSIDVRNYFQLQDNKIPVVSGSNYDAKALTALKKVRAIMKYKNDKPTYGFSEYWAYPYQTLKRKIGDCEDGAILLANIMVKSGIPYYRVRLNAGSVWDGRSTAMFLRQVDTNIYGDKKCHLKKETDYGTMKKVKEIGLKKAKDSINQQNLRKAVFLATKEQENAELLFVNMVGKQLTVGQEFVKSVEQLIKKENLTFIIKTKTGLITLQKIYKYYVALAIVDTMEKREMLDSSEKEAYHGTKESNKTNGSAGHAYVTYCREIDNKFVVVDWCYWPNELKMKDRKTHKEERNYMNKDKNFYVWFSWNTKHIFGKQKSTEGFKNK